MSNILITGASGMLGKALCKTFPIADTLNGRSDIDLSKLNSLGFLDSMKKYDYIIHTAAITNMQHNESRPSEAYHLHSGIIQYLQNSCKKLIYISAQGRSSSGELILLGRAAYLAGL